MDAPDRGEGAGPVVLSAFAIAHLSFFLPSISFQHITSTAEPTAAGKLCQDA